MKRFSLLVSTALVAGALHAAPQSVLFVGNSYTFGRVDPVLSYNAANVDDMTRPRPDLPDPNFTETAGTRAWEPHPWGGVPGIFKQLADQAGEEFDVALSTRNAASLRGHFLNTANADWDLRGNIAKRKWDVVVLQEQSDAALPKGRGANANYPQFAAYADKIAKYVQVGAAESYRRTRDVPGHLRERRQVRRSRRNGGFVQQSHAARDPRQSRTQIRRPWCTSRRPGPGRTWCFRTSPRSPTRTTRPCRTVGRSSTRTSGTLPNGYPDTLYYETEGLAAMTADLRAAFASKAATNTAFAGVIPVGDAFQRALDDGIAKRDGFYNAEGTYAAYEPSDKINLWWDDYLHASRHGSYLSALVVFGTLTGISPASFGASEKAAADLGISPGDAVRLQRVAADQLAASGTPTVWIPCLRANPDAPGQGAETPRGLACRRGD